MHVTTHRRGVRRVVAAAAVTALGASGLALSLSAPAYAAPFVTGKVTDSAGRPIADAEVTVYDAADGDELTVRATGSDGVFKAFTTAASVKVRVEKFTVDDRYGAEWFNDKASEATADPIAVPATGADIGVIALTSGGSISGVVTSDAGAPLNRVQVTAFGDGEDGYGSDWTDETGAYSIKGLEADSYRVSFSDPVIDEYATEYYNNTTTFSATTPVVVGKDAAVGGINAGLAPVTPVPPTSGPDITGSVVDSAGVPAVGVGVSAYTVGAKERDAQSVGRVYTNRQGLYTFTGLDTTGETQFRIESDSYQDEVTDFARLGTWSGGAQTYRGATPVVITPGGAAATQNLDPVVAGGVSGTVVSDAGNAPASGGTVRFYDAEGNVLGGASGNADGT